MRGRERDQRRACQRGCGPHRGRSDHVKPGSKRFGRTASSGRYPRAHGRMTDRDRHSNDQKQSPRRSDAYKRIGPSGSVNRLLRPDSVRHMSVTTAMQGLTAAHHGTQWDCSKAAREPGYAQAMGRFRRWWQVLGSNQRRLSRRFYRTPIPTHRNTHRPAHSPFLTASNPRSVRPASVHTKSPRSARRGCRVPVQGSPVESRCVPLGPPSPSPPPGVRSDLSGGDPRVQP